MPQTYELWLGGSFTRGFDVSVDGHPAGSVRDEISDIDGYVPVAKPALTAGVHTITITYPPPGLTPGSGATSSQSSARSRSSRCKPRRPSC